MQTDELNGSNERESVYLNKHPATSSNHMFNTQIYFNKMESYNKEAIDFHSSNYVSELQNDVMSMVTKLEERKHVWTADSVRKETPRELEL